MDGNAIELTTEMQTKPVDKTPKQKSLINKLFGVKVFKDDEEVEE